MTRDELITDVWHDLPVSKYLIGRARVDRLTARALKAWHPPVLDQCDEAQCRIVNKYLARSIERQERNEYGMGFIAAPLVEEHRTFVKSLSETQREISQAIGEQTRLLYALQPRSGDEPPKN